jgi:predicted amidophosphoribosyltransferase
MSLPTPWFGRCASCPAFTACDAAQCYPCFRQSASPIPPSGTCAICSLPVSANECGNPICNWDERYFRWNRALGYVRNGSLLHQVIVGRYKYAPDASAWGLVLGALIAGFIEEQSDFFSPFDLIIPNPTFTGAGARRSWDHTAFLVSAAGDALGDSWPIQLEPPLIIKTADTRQMMTGTWRERHEIATELRKVLQVPSARRVAGQKILVIDDIFTDGHTLYEVARALRNAGASRVCGLTLGRQQYGGSRSADS